MNRDLIKAIFLQASKTTCMDGSIINNGNNAPYSNEDIIHECDNLRISIVNGYGGRPLLKKVVANIRMAHLVPPDTKILHLYASQNSMYISIVKGMIPVGVTSLTLTLESNTIEKNAIPPTVKELIIYGNDDDCDNLLSLNIPQTVKYLRISGKIHLVPKDIPFGVMHVEFLDDKCGGEYVAGLFPDSVTHLTLRTNGSPIGRMREIFPRNLKMLDFNMWDVYEEFEEGSIPDNCAFIHYPEYFNGIIPKYAKYVFFEKCMTSIEKMNLPNNICILDIGMQLDECNVHEQDLPICLSILAVPREYINNDGENNDKYAEMMMDYDDYNNNVECDINIEDIMDIGNMSLAEQDGCKYMQEKDTHINTNVGGYNYERSLWEDETRMKMEYFMWSLDRNKYLVLEYDDKHKNGYYFKNGAGIYECITFDEMKNVVGIIEDLCGYGWGYNDGRKLKGRIIYGELMEKVGGIIF